MTYDIAVYVGDCDKLRSIFSALEEVFAGGEIHSGAEISDAIRPNASHYLVTPLIHILVNEGVLHTHRSSLSIGGYLFSIDKGTFSSFCADQLAACKIVEEINSRTDEKSAQRVEFVATLPPSLLLGSVTDIGTIDHALRRMMVSAGRSIWIANPFFDDFGMDAITDSLVGRLGLGVEVRLLTRGVFDRSDGLHVRPLLCRFLESVAHQEHKDKLTIRDFFDRDSRTGRVSYALHSKVVIVDNNQCYLGSANVTQHGLRNNFELGVILRGTEVSPVSELFERVWAKSIPVLLNDLR